MLTPACTAGVFVRASERSPLLRHLTQVVGMAGEA
jgi:hypothetical protein